MVEAAQAAQVRIVSACTRRRVVAAVMVGALMVAAAACSSDEGASAPGSTVADVDTTTAGTAAAPSSSTGAAAATTAASTTGAPSTTAATATSVECPPAGSTDEVKVGFPQTLSGFVGADARTGAHPCFERVVFEFDDSVAPDATFPGYWVRYADGPVELSPSAEPVTIAGDAALLVSFGSWMQNSEGDGYSGPTDVVPTNVSHILELRMIENFEGMSSWAVGLDAERPMTVSTLTDPPRLVIDVQTGP